MSRNTAGNNGLHYKKDGSLDMRYASSKAAAASANIPSSSNIPTANYQPAPRSYSSPAPQAFSNNNLHYRKDGQLDMRYVSSKEMVSNSSAGTSATSRATTPMGYAASSHNKQNSSNLGYTGSAFNHSQLPNNNVHLKKDGSLDMRYKSSKEASKDSSIGRPASSVGTDFLRNPILSNANSSNASRSEAYSKNPYSNDNLHYKKDGSLDMRFASSKEATTRTKHSPMLNVNADGSKNFHYKKDGSLDMRYSSSKEAAGSGSSKSFSTSNNSTDLHLKKDGTPDMRYSSSKQHVNKGMHSNSNPEDKLHYKKDGSLDMRYKSSRTSSTLATDFEKQIVLDTARKNSTDWNIPNYVPLKGDGTPDMRKTAAKQWVAEQALYCKNMFSIPEWVPRNKDGSINLKTAIGRAFAGECKIEQPKRDDYWNKRKYNKEFSDQVEAERMESIDLPQRPPIIADTFPMQYMNDNNYADQLFQENFAQPEPRYVGAPMSQLVPSLYPSLEMNVGSNTAFEHSYEHPNRYFTNSLSITSDNNHSIAVSQKSIGDCSLTSTESLRIAYLIDYKNLKFAKDDENQAIIGKGAFGVVLKASFNDTDVAVKKLHIEQLTNKEKKSFSKEIAILAHLGEHENLVKLIGYCLTPPCIVMELIKLGSLSYLLYYCEDPIVEARITDGRIKKKIIFGIANGMDQLHTSNIIHGDLKPQNVLITNSYEAKITDFGLAQLRGKTSSTIASKKWENKNDDEIDPIGGTAGYMAPELLDSTKPPEFACDVYSFGVLLNELISEEEPFSDQYQNFAGRGPFGAVNYARQGMRPTISKTTPHFIKQLITSCWAAEQEKRPDFESIISSIEDTEFNIPHSF